MKKVMGLVIILAVIILSSYYVMGYFTEKELRKKLKTAVEQTNGLSVNIETYNRGWFTSNALLNWRLTIPEHEITSEGGQSKTIPAEEYRLNMPLTVYHGPAIFADKTIKLGLGYAHTDLKLPPKIVEHFNNTFSSNSTQPKLELSFFISYLTNTSLDMTIPPFNLLAKEGNWQLEWQGMTSATNTSSDMKKISGNITAEGLRFTNDQAKVMMAGMTSEYDLQKNAGFYLGDASISFPSTVFTFNNQNVLSLSQLDAHSDSNIENGLFSSHLKVSVDKIDTNDQKYGPGHIEIAIRNLDANVLTRINEQINQIQQGNDAQRQQILLAILPELPGLFNKGAEFEIPEMSFAMPQGTVEGNVLISLPKGNITNPFEMLQKSQGKGKLKLPAQLLKDLLIEANKQVLMAPPPPKTIQQGIVQELQQQNAQAAPASAQAQPDPNAIQQQATTMADKQLATMGETGFLVAQGNNYVVDLSLNQGQLTINGKPWKQLILQLNSPPTTSK